jgi:hypothetical protein
MQPVDFYDSEIFAGLWLEPLFRENGEIFDEFIIAGVRGIQTGEKLPKA